MPGFVEPPGLLEGCCGEVGSLEGAGESVPGLGLLGSRVPVGLSGLPGVAGLSVEPVEGFVEGSVEGLLVGSEEGSVDGLVEGSVLGLVLGSVGVCTGVSRRLGSGISSRTNCVLYLGRYYRFFSNDKSVIKVGDVLIRWHIFIRSRCLDA